MMLIILYLIIALVVLFVKRRKKIIDCFTFFIELDILEKRLTYLDKYVDYFVIVESPNTFVGNEKPMYFEDNKHRFSKWLHKIIHVKTKPLGENFWDREKYKDIVKDNTLSTQDDTTWQTWERESQQRHSILDGLVGFENDDIVMISDVDEIPDYKFIRDDYEEPVTFKMWLFRYSLEYMVNHHCDWDGTVLTTVGDAYNKSPNKLRDGRYFNKKMENSGWHFTKFGDENAIRMMYSNYSHHKDFNYEDIIKNKTQHGSNEKLLTRLESVYIPSELE